MAGMHRQWLVLGFCLSLLLVSSCEGFAGLGKLPLKPPGPLHAGARKLGNFMRGAKMMQPKPPADGKTSKTVLRATQMEDKATAPGELVKAATIGDKASMPPYELSVQQKVYLWLTGLFVACLLIADVIGVKLFEIPLPFEIFGYKSVEHSCGMLTFPITFILGDVINEYYGKAAAKQTVYIGLAMSILTFTVINFAQVLPFLDAPYNVSEDSFNMIFGSSKMLYIASLCAYTLGNLTDIWLFGIIKKATGGKNLWLRATGSTVLSQLLDSFVVTYLAFGIGKTLTGQPGASISQVLNIAVTGYGLKFFLALCVTPIIYITRDLLHNKFGLEAMPSDTADKE